MMVVAFQAFTHLKHHRAVCVWFSFAVTAALHSQVRHAGNREAQEAERSALVVAQLMKLCVFICGSAEFSETLS